MARTLPERARTTTDSARGRRAPALVVALALVLGASVAASGAATPAQAAGTSAGLPGLPDLPGDPILDPILDPLPVPLPGPGDLLQAPAPSILGGGSLATPGGYLCGSAADPVATPLTACDPVPLLELVELGAIELVPTPDPGWAFDGWTGAAPCPTDPAVAQVCVLTAGVLGAGGSALQPVAEFVPIPGFPGGDTTQPVTTITAATTPGWQPSASFAFTADEADATFECRLAGPGRTDGFVPCTSPASYDGLAAGVHVFMVRATDPAGNVGDTAMHRWTVTLPPIETWISAGPRNRAWVLGNAVAYRYRSNVAGARFTCTVDGRARVCGAGSMRAAALRAGSHVFAVAAADAAGTRDLSPATRVFTVPLDDRALTGARWVNRVARGHFKDTYRMASVRGTTLRVRAVRARTIVLLADRGPGQGAVNVYLGGRLLRRVNLSAPRVRVRQALPVASFRSARSGLLRVVVATSGKPVRIDGLGVATR